jgi:Ca2+-binding RTX toxin-like protein
MLHDVLRFSIATGAEPSSRRWSVRMRCRRYTSALRTRLVLAASMLAAATVLCAPATASANIQVTTGGYDLPGLSDPGDALIVSGSNGVDDSFTVTFVPNGVGTGDDEVHVTAASSAVQDIGGPGGACEPDVAGTTMVCLLSSIGDPYWILVGGSGDDRVQVAGPASPSNLNVYLIGGLGSDELIGGPGSEIFYGEQAAGGGEDCHDPVENSTGVEDCDDTIRDGLGRDTINGEGGSDTVIQPPLGSSSPDGDEDVFNLSDGSADTVSYELREASRPVTIRNPSTDGSGTPGEEDDLQAGIERVVASPGNDTIIGMNSPVPLSYDAGSGNDTFWAGSSSETFIGGSGTDRLRYDDPGQAYSGIVATANGIADDGNDPLFSPDDMGADIEEIVGSLGTDTITGAPVAGCRIAGGASADTLTAGSVGCILEGGDGADILVGGAGPDVIRPGASGTASSDVVTFGGGSDTADYGTASMVGTDASIVGVQASAAAGVANWCHGLGVGTTSARKTVAALPHLDAWNDAPEAIVGTVATDTLCGGPAGTTLTGGSGADVLTGGSGNDTLIGDIGGDSLNGQAGSDTLDGGDGSDTLNGGAGADVVDGGDGNDVVRGGGGADTLRGGAGDDQLVELSFSTVMQGLPEEELDGPDVLDGGAGTDTLDGNLGDDVIACTAESLQDAVSDSGGGVEVFDCSALGGGVTWVAGSGIDRVIGTAFDDVLSGALQLDGGAGDDTLTAPASGGTLMGGAGNDTLRGGAAADVLDGGDGADTLDGGDGDDVLAGGAGGDVLRGGAGSETISYADRGGAVTVTRGDGADDGQVGEGDDVGSDIETIVGTPFADSLSAGSTGATLAGGGGNDVLVGSPAGDAFDGGAGNDRLVSGGGDDTLTGGDGDDTLAAGPGVDQVDGGAGNDVLDGGDGADALLGGDGIDVVSYASRTKPVIVGIGIGRSNDGERNEKDDIGVDVEGVVGGRGNDRIVGSALANVLRGGSGNDVVDGGAGNDRLFGGPGNDRLTGRAGNDQLRGEAGSDQLDARDASPRDRRFRELVDGGAGRDAVFADSADRVLRAELRRRAMKGPAAGR